MIMTVGDKRCSGNRDNGRISDGGDSDRVN